ncbi:Os01g0170100, partial [Oryza sativa Japonica Group]
EHKINAYRDRAAERRILHRGIGIGPGQKQSSSTNFYEHEETSEGMDLMGGASVDMNFRSSGLNSAKKMMENMGWKEGEALGKSTKGMVEPIQPTVNKHGAGLGWKQTR